MLLGTAMLYFDQAARVGVDRKRRGRGGRTPKPSAEPAPPGESHEVVAKSHEVARVAAVALKAGTTRSPRRAAGIGHGALATPPGCRAAAGQVAARAPDGRPPRQPARGR